MAMLREARVRPSLRLDSHLLHPPPTGAVVMTRRMLAARIFDYFHIVFKEPSRRIPMRITRPVTLGSELRYEVSTVSDR